MTYEEFKLKFAENSRCEPVYTELAENMMRDMYDRGEEAIAEMLGNAQALNAGRNPYEAGI